MGKQGRGRTPQCAPKLPSSMAFGNLINLQASARRVRRTDTIREFWLAENFAKPELWFGGGGVVPLSIA